MTVASLKTLHSLEYDRLKELLKNFCFSSLAKQAIDVLEPTDDPVLIEQGIAETREAMSFLEQASNFSLGGVRDLVAIFHDIKKHVSLNGEELLVILRTIEATCGIRDQLTSRNKLALLCELAERLSIPKRLAQQIYDTIDENGEIRIDASPTLARLTRKKQTLEGEIQHKLQSLIDRNPDLISEAVITRRSGRLVIPIRSGATGAMKFVVHDRSATGQTLYAEPTSLVAENNAIAELESSVREERLRILRELTQEVRSAERLLLRNQAILTHIDFLFTRASYAAVHRCAFPRLSDSISLIDARHPLLAEDKVVPITLSFGDDARMVVITGPNTGGKTVTLKTVGLLTLMVQSIIPIQNIVDALSVADSHSLILLDELGAGTDPQEGAALGLSILEELLEKKAFVAVSTHLTALKYFAIRRAAVKTASMEFDVRTLSPTFRVVEGIPGQSNAFVIAHRLGLANGIVERAHRFLSQEQIKTEDIIRDLQRTRQDMLHHRKQLQRELSSAEELKETYNQRLASFEQAKVEELPTRVRKLDSFLRQGQERIEKLLGTINANRPEQEIRDEYQQITGLRQSLKQEEEEFTASQKEGELIVPEDLRSGGIVYVRSVRADGRIIHVSQKGRVSVEVDGIKLRTNVSDLAPARGTLKTKPRSSRLQLPEQDDISLQLNIRGMTISEALPRVEIYLDRLLLTDIKRASILHGKGTGALRDSVRDYLSSYSSVKSYGPATPREGGEGVTTFEFVE
jgi:DNA mismatch repair protein MutS2